jgi:hypothetical protein
MQVQGASTVTLTDVVLDKSKAFTHGGFMYA